MLSFKGPVLALTLYGDVGARPFTDLDVLVPPTAVAAAEQRFADLGYARKRDFEYEVTLVNPAIGIKVDLHRTLTPANFPVAIRFARLWERRDTVPLEGGCVETLRAADLAITLCMEAVKDARVGHVSLGKVSDLARLFSQLSETDWALVASESRRVGVEQVLCFAFRLTADLLRIPAPSPAGSSRVHNDGSASCEKPKGRCSTCPVADRLRSGTATRFISTFGSGGATNYARTCTAPAVLSRRRRSIGTFCRCRSHSRCCITSCAPCGSRTSTARVS